jgi:hypothetical protein
VPLTERKDARAKALIRARLRGAGGSRDVCILDVSARGLLVTGADAPPRGQFVELLTEHQALVGHVEWSHARRFGVSLRTRIDVGALLRGEAGDISEKARAQVVAVGIKAPWFGGSRGLGQAAQFAVLVAAGVGAAIAIGHMVGLSLHGLHEARVAMAAH